MISPLAQIHPKANIADGVIIDAFSVIHEDVEIGAGTHIMSHVSLFPGTRIGKECKIFPGAVIGAVPQDLKFKGEYTLAEIGDHTTVREYVTIHRGTADKKTTKVGSNCLLMAYAHVAHDCIVGNHVILANAVQLAGHVTVDDYAIIGGMSAAHQFTHIGAHTYVAGMSGIRKDVPPFVKAAREPLSYVGINTVGLSRRGFTKEAIEEIANIYHILFIQKHTVSQALTSIETTLPVTPLRTEILSFIRQSEIGIIKRHSKSNDDEDLAF